jgi:hypothetical protein
MRRRQAGNPNAEITINGPMYCEKVQQATITLTPRHILAEHNAWKRHSHNHQFIFSFAVLIHPLASTIEQAVVGVGAPPRPMYDLVL